MKTFARLLFFFITFTAILSCSKTEDAPAVPEKFFQFDVNEVQLRTGEQQTVALREGITNYPFAEITYQSMDENIAKIVDGRTVQSIAPGTTVIRAMRGNVVLDSFKVIIVNGVVTSISLVPATTTLKKEQTFQLTPVLAPAIAIDKSITWSSSDPSVATVNQTGRITAIKAGEATISATTATNLTVKCIVKVE